MIKNLFDYDDQGIIGAFVQYFNIEDKPRLNRKNTYFEDHKPSLKTSNRFYVTVSLIALAITLWMVI